MRTTTATLGVILLDKPTKSGTYPIVIRAFWHGRAEKRTGISIPRNMWSDHTSSIKPSYPNAAKLNSVIQRMYTEALNRKIELESKGPLKDVRDIFKEDPISDTNYFTLLSGMIKDRSLSLGSEYKYIASYNDLCKFLGEKTFEITILNQDRLMSYAKWMKNKGLMNSTIIERLYNICAVWQYAINNELVDAGLNPFRKFNPRKVYKSDETKRAIEYKEYRGIESILSNYINSNIRDMAPFGKWTTNEYALAVFVMGYLFGGLAFVDMIKLRKSQVITKRIGNGTYYLLNDVVRQKTNRPVPIIFKKDMISAPLMEYYLSAPGEWLIPSNCHTGNPVTDRKHLYSIEKSVNLHLRKATGLDITYYVCRHSYASHYMFSEGSNPVCLATMMGRSVNGIFRYVKTLTSDEEIIKERMRMGL